MATGVSTLLTCREALAPAMCAHSAPAQETNSEGTRPAPRLLFGAAAAVAMYLYLASWPVVPPDMVEFLFPWYGHILEQGPIGAFGEPFSNYTPPYLYLLAVASTAHDFVPPQDLIKLLAVAGTGFLAVAVADLLKALGGDWKRAALVFLLPTVILNAALLGQCDALWAGACVFALAAMIRGSTAASLVWCGVAIAFKAQAAFVAPFFIGALIGRRAPLWQWAIPSLVYVALMLPAGLRGWPAADLALVYIRQVHYFDFPGNLANPWAWASHFASDAAPSFYWLGYAAAASVAMAVGALAAGSTHKPKVLLALALLSATALPFVLPKMHERYQFLADILALALALVASDRKAIAIAVAVQFTSLTALVSYIYAWPTPALIGAIGGAWACAAIFQWGWDAGARWPVRPPAAGSLFALPLS